MKKSEYILPITMTILSQLYGMLLPYELLGIVSPNDAVQFLNIWFSVGIFITSFLSMPKYKHPFLQMLVNAVLFYGLVFYFFLSCLYNEAQFSHDLLVNMFRRFGIEKTNPNHTSDGLPLLFRMNYPIGILLLTIRFFLLQIFSLFVFRTLRRRKV